MKVTAFVKYDLYPHYIVLEGELQENFDVKTSCGTFNHAKVITVKPISELDRHREDYENIRKAYDRLHTKLKVDILKQHGVDFINTDKL
uniref:Uncharacterized protein n=1 Tax=Salmonella phage vB_SEnST11_KE23 TaxID=3161174 RepID=A0AAU8GGQ6_9CAUD